MIAEYFHKPVMPKEVEEYLITSQSGVYVDCTLGGGGHSGWLLKKHPGINIIGIDWDKDAIKEAESSLSLFKSRVRIFRENFRDIRKLLDNIGIKSVNGVILDLGVSSKQLNEKDRGFNFQSPVLDMRMDDRIEKRAFDIINSLSEEELSEILFKFGEERFSRQISRAIVRERKTKQIDSGQALSSLVEKIKKRHGKTHPATTVFQAIRIAVNRELENLTLVLDELPYILKAGARAVVLSYHSIEDRIVKQNFRKFSKEGDYNLLTKKVVFPSLEEIRTNPRSRSAKLRSVERLG